MSGICGIVNLDGAPCVPEELERLTTFLDSRGPDAHRVWSRGQAGFGHTLLRTTHGGDEDPQPCTLDGEVWLTADARIDGRDDLARKLKAAGREVSPSASDAQLILQAYHAWGEECARHFIGDFAFAIWDGRARRLFCARDHFGVKPFFYGCVNGSFVFSNTLNGVRAHPGIGSRLNELAIADFLLFERNQDPASTVYADVRRLAPATCLTATASGIDARRYWSLPFGVRVQYRDAGEYVERFDELLEAAVADRIRTDRVSVMMSGGMDSAGVAAASMRLPPSIRPHSFHANTTVYDRLIRDEERFYAGLVAERLGMSIGYRPVDNYTLYERYEDLAAYLPEPFHDPLAVVALDLTEDAASHGRVVLTGYDGDALFSESPRPYFGYLLKERRVGRFLASAVRFAFSERKILPTGTLGSLTALAGPAATRWREPYPAWLNPDFERRLRLPERFAQYVDAAPVAHPIRPFAFKTFDYLMRHSTFFDRSDPGCTGHPVEYRHPLLDLRLIEHCLSLPPYPWCRGKQILRTSMRDALPEAVLTRPKTPLGACPYHERLKKDEARWVDRFAASAQTSAFVDRAKIPTTHQEADPYNAWVNLRPLSLDFWLRAHSGSLVSQKETFHEA